MALKVGILAGPQTWHSQRLAAAWGRHGIQPAYFDAQRLRARLGNPQGVDHLDQRLAGLDLLMVRDVPGGSLEQVIYRMDALHQLEDLGVRLVNRPGAVEKMVDKYYTLSLCAKAGLRVPETVVTESAEEAYQAFNELGRDVVLKPLFGSRGIGMVRLTDREIAGRTFRALELGHYVYYLQRFIPHANRDVRTLVIGTRCAAAMERVSDGWKTNVAQGAHPVPYQPDAEGIEMSLRAAEAVGADYCGVDLMRGEDGGLYLLEVNSMPAWEGLQKVCAVDVAEQIVDYLLGLVE